MDALTKKNFEDLTDKVLYLPKTIFSSNGNVPTLEEIKKELIKNGEKPITQYLKNLLNRLAVIKFLSKAHFDDTHIKNFVKAYGESLKFTKTNYYSVKSKKVISSTLRASFDDLAQTMMVTIKKVPPELGMDQSVMEIDNLFFYPILVNELVY